MSGPEQKERRRDGEARRRAQTEFRRPQVLEAGAGTGKTTALVARVLAWCVGPGWAEAAAGGPGADPEAVAGRVLDGVVAITFTEDAAAEMAQRVAEGLADLARWRGDTEPTPDWPGRAVAVLPDGAQVRGVFAEALPEDPAAVRERAALLLAQVERLRVGTIHAFARSLLARYPVEAGLHPSFEVDGDGRRLEALVDEVVEAELAAGYREGEPGVLALAAAGHGPAEVAETVRRLVELGVPPEALEEDPFDDRRTEELLDHLRRALAPLEEPLHRLEALGESSTDARAARWLLRLWRLAASEEPVTARLEACTGAAREEYAALEGRLREWAKAGFTKRAHGVLPDPAAFAAAMEALRPALSCLARMDREGFAAWRRVLRPILLRVEAERRRRGIVTYHDLLVRARRLLERHPEVAGEVRRGIRQLLVDEVQDTDPEQAAIVRTIALEGPEAERPGLLLVGDPKQSIYGWRDADLAVYEELVAAALGAGGEFGRLAVNFRSAPALLAEADRVVGEVMKAHPGLQPAYQRLLPCAARAGEDGPEAPGGARVEHWASVAAGGDGRPQKTAAREAARLEAEAVAEEIAELVERPDGPAYSDIAILMRSRGQQEAFLEALRERGIPYVVGADWTHYRTREVAEAVALVRLVLDRHDALALAAVLRSPVVGAPDAALLPLWREGLPSLMAAVGPEGEVPEGLVAAVRRAAGAVAALPVSGEDRRLLEPLAGWPEAVLRFAGHLAALRRAAAEGPPDRFVEALRQRTFLEPLAAGRFPGHYRLASLDRFLRELESRLLEGATRGELLAWLRRVARERPEEEAGRPREDVEGVRVLTVHGAKGLGFRHVYLVQTGAGRRGGGGRPAARARLVDGRWELEIRGLPTPGFFRVEERETAVAEAERVRLLYVALTRAEERLVTVGCWDPARPGEAVFLDLLRQRSGGWPKGVADLWGDGAPPAVERDGARWVWLGHPGRRTSPRTARRRAAGYAGGESLARDAGRLARRREAAAAVMRRPFLGGVTDEPHRRLAEAVAAGVEGAESPEEEAAAARRQAARADVGAAVGGAVHRVLERFDLAAGDPGAELERRAEEAAAWLETALPPELVPEARQHLADLLAAFRSGPLWERWLEVSPRVVARELPVLLPPDRSPAPEGERPAGALVGYADLVYLSEADGAPVVVDFKTDDPGWLEERAPAYAEQVRLYAAALREALGLSDPPRAELWFLAAGVIRPVA